MEIGTFRDIETTTRTIWFSDFYSAHPDFVRVTNPSEALDAIARKLTGRSDVRALHVSNLTYEVRSGDELVRYGDVGLAVEFRLTVEASNIINGVA